MNSKDFNRAQSLVIQISKAKSELKALKDILSIGGQTQFKLKSLANEIPIDVTDDMIIDPSSDTHKALLETLSDMLTDKLEDLEYQFKEL